MNVYFSCPHLTMAVLTALTVTVTGMFYNLSCRVSRKICMYKQQYAETIIQLDGLKKDHSATVAFACI